MSDDERPADDIESPGPDVPQVSESAAPAEHDPISTESQGAEARLPAPRHAGSAAELRASEQVVARFQAADVPVVSLTSSIPAAGTYAELVCVPLAMAALLVSIWSSVVGLIALLAVVALYLSEKRGAGRIASVFPGITSVNVLAAIPAQRRDLRRLILTVPLDTPRTGALPWPVVRRIARYLPVLVTIGLAVAIAVAAGHAAARDSVTVVWLIVPAALLTLALALAGERELRDDLPPLEDPAAAGIASVVTVAERLRRHPAHWVDVWCLITGGGASTPEGIRAFVRENDLDLDTTYFLNLHATVAGSPQYAAEEGLLFAFASAPALARILAGAGRPAGSATAPPLARLREDTQALVPIRAGYQAITLTGAAGPEPTASGTADHVAEVILAAISALDTEMVERNRMARLARIAGSHAPRFPTRQGQ